MLIFNDKDYSNDKYTLMRINEYNDDNSYLIYNTNIAYIKDSNKFTLNAKVRI